MKEMEGVTLGRRVNAIDWKRIGAVVDIGRVNSVTEQCALLALGIGRAGISWFKLIVLFWGI
jgi:hypothetical protein